MNIGKAAILALVASWAIYGQERVRIPQKKAGGGFSGGGGPAYGPFGGDKGYSPGGNPYR